MFTINTTASNVHGTSVQTTVNAVGPNHTSRSEVLLEQQLVAQVTAIRDTAFDPAMLRDLALSLIGANGDLPLGPEGDAARTALNEMLRPFPADAKEKPFVPSARAPIVPAEMRRQIIFGSTPQPDLTRFRRSAQPGSPTFWPVARTTSCAEPARWKIPR